MDKRADASFRAAIDEAKANLSAGFQAEKGKAAAAGALGGSGLFIAFQGCAQEVASEMVERMLESVERLSSRYDLDRTETHASAVEVFDQFVQFVVQSYETENRLQSQARRVNAPPIHSSLFRIPRQRLSTGFAENMAREPLSKRMTKLLGKLRGAG